jgi:hypothetical protein
MSRLTMEQEFALTVVFETGDGETDWADSLSAADLPADRTLVRRAEQAEIDGRGGSDRIVAVLPSRVRTFVDVYEEVLTREQKRVLAARPRWKVLQAYGDGVVLIGEGDGQNDLRQFVRMDGSLPTPVHSPASARALLSAGLSISGKRLEPTVSW